MNKKISYYRHQFKLQSEWYDGFYYRDEDCSSSEMVPISRLIDKQIISAILGILLNFTVFVPSSSATGITKKFDNAIIEQVISNSPKKILKKKKSPNYSSSQKIVRKNKAQLENSSRLILFKEYCFLNRQLKKFSPSLQRFEKPLGLTKSNQFKKNARLLVPYSQQQENVIFRIKQERLRLLRSGGDLSESNYEDKKTPNVNISSSVLKNSIKKLIKKINFWICSNPTLFSLIIIANVSLIYLYREGIFSEFYDYILNSSSRFFENEEYFDIFFEGANDRALTFFKKIYIRYFTNPVPQEIVFPTKIVKLDPVIENPLDTNPFWQEILASITPEERAKWDAEWDAEFAGK